MEDFPIAYVCFVKILSVLHELYIYSFMQLTLLLLGMATSSAAVIKPLGLLPPKRIKTIDWTKWLICQVDKTDEKLRAATHAGLE